MENKNKKYTFDPTNMLIAGLVGLSTGPVLGALTLPLNKLFNRVTSFRTKAQLAKNHLKTSTLLSLLGGSMIGAALGIKKQASADNNKTDDKLIPALSLGAALATYALSRHGINKNLAQQMSKGDLTWASYGPGYEAYNINHSMGAKTPWEKLMKQVKYGDIEFLDLARPKTLPKSIRGAMYADTDPFSQDYKLLPKSDITYNDDAEAISKILQDKLNFAKLKNSGSVVDAQTVAEKFRNPKSTDQLLKRIDSYKKPIYIKKREDFASSAIGHFSDKDFRTLIEKRKAGKILNKKETRALEDLINNQEKYIVQPQIKLDKLTAGVFEDYPATEHRINILTHKGEVQPISSYRRWINPLSDKTPYLYNPLPDRKLTNEGLAELQDLFSKNPRLQKKNFILGADVVRDTDGKVRIVEINDSSGYLDPEIMEKPFGAHRLYKAVTGRDTRFVAALKALGVGGGTYGVASLATNE